jgi:16S rRNA (uracil1498-N3)-methyltransferase
MIGSDSSHLEPQLTEPNCSTSPSIMTRRYYVPDLSPSGGLVTLPDTEAQHATRVMRVQPGDAIELFDGKGNQAPAIVVDTGRKACHCEAESPQFVDREPERSLHLGVALPKPDRARELIERLTELGVKTVTPIVAQRTQRAPSESLLEKLRRGVIEACKQSGRNQLLEIMAVQTSEKYFSGDHVGARWIAHPSDAQICQQTFADQTVVTAAVGPEGGWNDDEVQLAHEHEFETVDLGQRIYRIETAATVIAAFSTSPKSRQT